MKFISKNSNFTASIPLFLLCSYSIYPISDVLKHNYTTKATSRNYRAVWTRGNIYYLHSWSSRFESRPVAWNPDILRGFPQFLQSNARLIPRLVYNRFLPNHFKLLIHPTIQRYTVSTLKASLKPRKTMNLWGNIINLVKQRWVVSFAW